MIMVLFLKQMLQGITKQVVYNFDGTNGKYPTGALFKASDGMLYGVT